MLKYAPIHGILAPSSLSNNTLISALELEVEGVELLGYLKLSCNFVWKSLAGYAQSISLGFCRRLNNVRSDITCPLQF